jgi:hypothetical protein
MAREARIVNNRLQLAAALCAMGIGARSQLLRFSTASSRF